MTAARSEPSGQAPARRLGLLYSAIACLVVFGGAAWLSWRYAPLPDPFEPAESRTFWQWITAPIEENAFRRLPVITGDLKGVFALKGTDHVWAVGDGGLMVHSADGGESWERQSVIDWSPTAPKETEPAAENDAFGVIRSAHASELRAPLRYLRQAEDEASLPAETAEVQRLLADLGYDPGPADGRPGEKTRAAIEQFQRAASLPVDGELTQALRDRLEKESAGRRAGQPPPDSNAPVELPTLEADSGAPVEGGPGGGGPGSGGPGSGGPGEGGPGPSPGPGGFGSGGSGSRRGGFPDQSPPVQSVDLRAVAFADERLGIAVGDQGVVWRTLDGGGHWRAATSGTEAGLRSVAFANAGRALAVGDGGTVFLSTDGGERWRYGGTVLLSTDGGERWQPKTIGTGARLLSVAFANAERALAVGVTGTVLLSTDGGERWQTKTSGTEAELWSVAFADAKRAVAVGDDGTVLLSTNGAESWQRKTSGTGAWLRSVNFANTERALAVGGGAVLVSTDGGERWQPKTSGTRAAPWSVNFANAERALAVGGGTVLVSTDGGERWQPKTSGTMQWLFSVAFATNAERAVAVGHYGTVLVSTDGGESWRPVEYRRYPAPLLLALSGAALLFGLLGAGRAWREVPVERRTVSVTDLFASDRPLRAGERDALDLGAIARGISRFLRNRQTEPPLTIAVTGEWGSGKSSLMGLLYEDLRGRGFRPVWFNAWHHQRGEHLLASLYANIRAQALPPAWTPEGLGFRWDLFWIRARRHWLWLLLTILLVSLVFGYLCFHPASGRWLIDLALKDSKGLWEEIGKTTLLGGGLLAALAPPLVGLYKAVGAFGLEPRRLLGSLAMDGGGALKAEPGVRYRFAAEFGDVTKALKPQTLVIFMDDLDRCTQEHVLEVLECINFLVTAGDCYIVLGMSRRWVETCVGLAFKELAAEAPDEAGGSNDATAVPVQPGQQASPSLLQADDPRDERRRFARQYLEKLVNIEVPIPRVGDAAAASLLAPPLRADPTRRVRAARWLHAKTNEWWLPLLLVAIATGAVGLATMLPEIGTEEPQATHTPSVSDKPEALPEKPPDEGSVVQTPEPLPTEDRVAFLPGERDKSAPIYHWGSAGFAVLALLALIGVLLGRRGRVQTDDSEDFRAALEVMRPWIVLGHPTPRLLKRCLNHVRFVAMRQRGDEEPESLAGSLLARLGLVPKPLEPLAPPVGLAEPVLVALSALHQSRLDWQIEPEWLLDDYANLKDGGISALVNTRLEDTAGSAELLAKLKKALDDYNQRFPANCLFADEQRDRQAIWTLLEAMAGVRIDGKVDTPVTATPVAEPAAATPA